MYGTLELARSILSVVGIFSIAGNIGLIVLLVRVNKKRKEQKRLKKEAELEEERYRVATELANDVIFEYDIKTDLMRAADKYKTIFGRNSAIYNYTESYVNLKYVHMEDRSVFIEFCNSLHIGKSKIEYEFRIQDANGDYKWCHIRAKTICGSDNLPARVIGKLVNIDIQKRELEKLQFKAQRDPLTNVYNKGVTAEKIKQLIHTSRLYEKHALFVIDIDDFKHVNDTYGHLEGDRVLVTLVKRVESMFRSKDIIGRIGGDEFVVMMRDVTSLKQVENKAAELGQALSHQFRKDEEKIEVSGSVGIALYPMDGREYEELLERADLALYQVKGTGKNHYMLYSKIKQKSGMM